ncbi:MAG TPA: DUF2085 domain-containing protein [Ktedonobacterales bacterium]|jgi:uncharacterized membrane protein|nr:DUF2085 domain-containing protein [Ktedonobacterales bacterium]
MSGDHAQDSTNGARADGSLDASQHERRPANTPATEAPALSWWSPENPGAPRTQEELATSLYGRAPHLDMVADMAAPPRSPGARVLHGFLDGIRAHWLTIVNSLLGALLGVALLAPLGYAFGLTGLSDGVFHAYRFICGQTPSHSFYIAGYQVCLCTRCMAIYGSMLIAGLTLALFRSAQLRPLNWKFWLLAMVPMALDGGTQLVGWRESNVFLRLLTGAIFGLGTAWFLFPQIEDAARDARSMPAMPVTAPSPPSRE